MQLHNFIDVIHITNIPDPNTRSSFTWKKKKIYNPDMNFNLDKVLDGDKIYKPSNKDKLYFFSDCTVPRYKVRGWAQKNKISITIKEENADVKFATPAILMDNITNFYGCQVKKDVFITWLHNNYNASYDYFDHLNLIDHINSSDGKYVFLHNKYTSYDNRGIVGGRWNDDKQNSANKGFKKMLSEVDPELENYYYTYLKEVKDGTWSNILNIVNDPKIYSQEQIIGLINEDAMVIDQEMYKRLGNMLSSDNNADKVLAIEIIANCNINPSLHHILLLMQEHNQTISAMKESTHVNFKSLLKYIGMDRYKMSSISDDDMVNYLLDKNVLTFNTVKELAEGVKEAWAKKFNTQHFKVNGITVSDEIKDYFKKQAMAKQEEQLITQ